jgi:LmbE family N-acetylglucosaminyl deacetylase
MSRDRNYGLAATQIDGDVLLKGTVLIAIPHSDDETLGCGAAIAEVHDKTRLHFVYVSNSSCSPEAPPGVPGVTAELPRIREVEARAALASFGVPRENATFLNIPDGHLSERQAEVETGIQRLCDRLGVDTLLAPFRFDSHPDHLAVNRAATRLVSDGRVPAELIEYFVYYRLKLLPRRDVRLYIEPRFLYSVGSSASTASKRRILDIYASQCTNLYPWQTRPILSKETLDTVVSTPECFFKRSADADDQDIFTVPALFIRTVHGLEPRLKKIKDRLKALIAGSKRA